MSGFLYFLKRTISFLRFHFVVLGCNKLHCCLFFTFFIFLSICLAFIDKDKESFLFLYILVVLLYFTVFSFFRYFVFLLKQQNFFVFFVLNRSFFSLKVEILSFVVSFFLIPLFVHLTLLPFFECSTFFIMLVLYLFALIEALIFCFAKSHREATLIVALSVLLVPFTVKFSILPMLLKSAIEFFIVGTRMIEHAKS